MKPTHIGCSGWNYADWRGRLYPQRGPQRRWLELYAARFDTVEVNSTFYRLARRTAVEAWVAETPPDFVFSVKASRYLTHVRRLQEIAEGIKRFYEPLQPLVESGRLGPVLWQLPANFRRDDERLRRWIALLPGGRHTIEFRDPSWFVPSVLNELRDAGVALTVGDHPERPFQPRLATTDWWFVRFHYGARGRAGNYSAAELATWSRRIAQWRRRRAVYAYFNNDWQGFAPDNALTLARSLGVERDPRTS